MLSKQMRFHDKQNNTYHIRKQSSEDSPFVCGYETDRLSYSLYITNQKTASASPFPALVYAALLLLFMVLFFIVSSIAIVHIYHVYMNR